MHPQRYHQTHESGSEIIKRNIILRRYHQTIYINTALLQDVKNFFSLQRRVSFNRVQIASVTTERKGAVRRDRREGEKDRVIRRAASRRRQMIVVPIDFAHKEECVCVFSHAIGCATKILFLFLQRFYFYSGIILNPRSKEIFQAG